MKRGQTHKYKLTRSPKLWFTALPEQSDSISNRKIHLSPVQQYPDPFNLPATTTILGVGDRSDRTLELSSEIEGAAYSERGLLPISRRLQKTNTAKGTKFSRPPPPTVATQLFQSLTPTPWLNHLDRTTAPQKGVFLPPPPSHTCLRGGPGARVQAGALPTPWHPPLPGALPGSRLQ